MDLDTITSKKVGGFPVIYAIAIVAAVGLFMALKSKTAAPAPATDPSIATDAGIDTSQPVFSATPVISQPSGPSVAATPAADTDTDWSRRCVAYLTTNGYTLDVATSAITKYLAGGELTSQEGQARDKAVAVYGLPPESLPSSTTDLPTTTLPPVNTPPASKQGTPPCNHTVKGTRDNTYGALAQLYYGFTGNGSLILIEGHNPGVTQPFHTGQVIVIPKLIAPVYYKATGATRTVYAIASKNGSSPGVIQALNPSTHFPVSIGTRVRIR